MKEMPEPSGDVVQALWVRECSLTRCLCVNSRLGPRGFSTSTPRPSVSFRPSGSTHIAVTCACTSGNAGIHKEKTHVHTGAYVRQCTRMPIYACVARYVWLPVYACMCGNACAFGNICHCVSMYVCTYACMRVCMPTYVCIFISLCVCMKRKVYRQVFIEICVRRRLIADRSILCSLSVS